MRFRRKPPQLPPTDPDPLTLDDVDIWAMRDMGFVDPELRDLLEASGDAEDIQLDYETAPTVEQLTYVLEQYEEMAKHLNETRLDGRIDWTAKDAWAMGRAAIAVTHGFDPHRTAWVTPWPLESNDV